TGVEPVWNSTKPGQDALAAIGMLKNLTGGAIDIQLSACTVIDGYMPGRHIATGSLQHPLISIHRAQELSLTIPAITPGKVTSSLQHLLFRQNWQGVSAAQADNGCRCRLAGWESKNGLAKQHFDAEIANWRIFMRSEITQGAAVVQLQGLKAAQALFRTDVRKFLVHHHKSGQAPKGHQQTHHYSKVAVGDQDKTHIRTGSCNSGGWYAVAPGVATGIAPVDWSQPARPSSQQWRSLHPAGSPDAG